MGMEKGCIVVLGVIAGVAILIISLVATSLSKVASDEVALKYDTISKILGDEPVMEGLHTGPPGFTFIKFPGVFKTLDYSRLQCLNKDGVQIYLSISFQYRVRAKDLKEVILQFKNHEGYEEVLRLIGSSALHDACSKFNTTQFQAERGAFQEDVRKRLVAKFDTVSCDVTDLQVNDIERPWDYETAIKKKEAAREEIEVAINERPQRLTAALTLKREAETQAGITLNKALSDARIIETKAASEAAGITDQFTKEAETYKKVKDAGGLNLNAQEFLQYLGVRTIESAKNLVYVGMDKPAKESWLP